MPRGGRAPGAAAAHLQRERRLRLVERCVGVRLLIAQQRVRAQREAARPRLLGLEQREDQLQLPGGRERSILNVGVA